MPEPSQAVGEKQPVAVVYGGAAEPARVVAERLAAGLRQRGFAVESRPIRAAAALDLARCAAVAVIAPIPMGGEEKDFLEFIQRHKESLERMPAAFLSMSVAGRSQPGNDPEPSASELEQSAVFVRETQATLDRLFTETGWRPRRHWPVGGAITYTRYNFLVRFILKLLAKGQPGLSREQGDWQALDGFLDEFEKEIRGGASLGRTQNGPVNRAGDP